MILPVTSLPRITLITAAVAERVLVPIELKRDCTRSRVHQPARFLREHCTMPELGNAALNNATAPRKRSSIRREERECITNKGQVG